MKSDYSAIVHQMAMLLQGQPASEHSRLSWPGLLHYAGQHLVLAGLQHKIPDSQAATLPVEMSDFIHTVYEKNTERNERLCTCFEQCSEVLNQQGIVPAPLKGLACIYDSIYLDAAERITSDIDLFIPPEQLGAALETLRDAGYRQITNKFNPDSLREAFDYAPIDVDDFRNLDRFHRYHVPAIVDDIAEFAIELHIRPTEIDSPAGKQLFDMVMRETETVSGPVQWLRTSDLFRLYHTFHHSQVKDELQYMGVVDWRHLLDAYQVLNTTQEPRLIEQCLSLAVDAGIDKECYCFFAQLHDLLNVDVPLPDLYSAARHRHHEKFKNLVGNKSRQARRHRNWRIRRFLATLSPRDLRSNYGPVSLPHAYIRWLRYRVHLRLNN